MICDCKSREKAMREACTVELGTLPGSASYQRLEYEQAGIIMLQRSPAQYFVVVTGTRPYLNMVVDLVPLEHPRTSDYWGIELIGRLYGSALPVECRFTVALPLTGTLGIRGVEV